jgi:hypothetical protein
MQIIGFSIASVVGTLHADEVENTPVCIKGLEIESRPPYCKCYGERA